MSTLYDYKNRYDSYDNWKTHNPVLKQGVWGIITDQLPNTLWWVIGDGSSAFDDLTVYKMPADLLTQISSLQTSVGTLQESLSDVQDEISAIQSGTQTVDKLVAKTLIVNPDAPHQGLIVYDNPHLNSSNESVQNTLLGVTSDASYISNGFVNINYLYMVSCAGASQITGANILSGQGSIYPLKINNVGSIGAVSSGNIPVTGSLSTSAASNVPCVSGNTASRPSSPIAGTQYLDTTLGKPIWYTGSAWVDATGATV